MARKHFQLPKLTCLESDALLKIFRSLLLASDPLEELRILQLKQLLHIHTIVSIPMSSFQLWRHASSSLEELPVAFTPNRTSQGSNLK